MDFLGSNGLPSRLAFMERKKYKQNMDIPEVDFIDLWYEKPNYGLYNADFEPVVLLAEDKDSTMSNFGDYANPNLYAVSFAVSAFNQFRDSYLSIVQETSISFPPFLENLVPKKAHVDFQASYSEYITRIAESLLSRITSVQRSIYNFGDFMKHCRQELYTQLKLAPITKSGFLLSLDCPINVSGLCIELSNQPYDQDFTKGKIVQTKEFKCYADVANQAGFYVDKNYPARLIANLESSVMQNHILKYFRDTSTENILSRLFRTKTHYDDLDSIQRFFTGLYNEFVDQNPFFEKVQTDSTSLETKRTLKLRPQIEAKYDVSWWIQELVEIRHKELGINITPDELSERKQLVLDLQDIYGVKYNKNGYSVKPALGKIGLYTSEYLKTIYENKKGINSYQNITIKDFM
mgnify:CR=1 FL=1